MKIRSLLILSIVATLCVYCNSCKKDKKSHEKSDSKQNKNIPKKITNNISRSEFIEKLGQLGLREEINFSKEDQEFLDDLEYRSYLLFKEQVNWQNGLMPDRCYLNGSGTTKERVASSASTGFALAAHCIGVERGWLEHERGKKIVRTTLKFFLEKVEHKNGFFYHFLELDTGKRTWESEASSIDTALFLAGTITAASYFQDEEINSLLKKIYDRVNWQWLFTDNKRTLCMGWSPEKGFIKAHWDAYSEHLILAILAIGADKNPAPAELWQEWQRTPILHYKGLPFLQYPPLFIHQYSHAFFDFRNKWDDRFNYFANSQIATLAQRDFMTKLGKKFTEKFGHYGTKLWGLSSSDSENGYKDWGGPYADNTVEPERGIDGSLSPHALGGSIAFVPQECLSTLKHMKQKFGEKIYGRYGFTNSFNPVTGYSSEFVIGIDTGNVLLMIENARTGFIWKNFMQNPNIKKAEKLIGFTKE